MKVFLMLHSIAIIQHALHAFLYVLCSKQDNLHPDLSHTEKPLKLYLQC